MTTRSIIVGVHLALVLLGLGYLVLSLTADDVVGANIGAGLAVLWLIALGSPWGWLLPATDLVGTSLYLLAAAGALLNLGLHALISFRRVRRQP